MEINGIFIAFLHTENLDRDQRRNLFAQEQSKKVIYSILFGIHEMRVNKQG